MTDLIDRALFLIIGLGIGFIFGFMTRSQIRIEKGIHHVERLVEKPRAKDEGGFMYVNRIVTDALYLLLLAVTLFGVIRAETALNKVEKAQQAIKDSQQVALEDRCRAGTDSRNVQRGIVDAVWTLGASFTVRDKNAPPPTPAEKAQTKAFLGVLNDFRNSSYADIKPSEQCEPYVTDVDVKPAPIDISKVVRQQGEQNG